MKRIFTLFLLLTSPLAYAGDTTHVTDRQSKAWINVESAASFLMETGEMDLSLLLLETLQSGRLYYEPDLDMWLHGKINACINGITWNVTFDETRISAHNLVSLNTSITEDDLTAATNLLNTSIHEMFHLIDFKTEGTSDELPTYQRSFHVYTKIIQYLFQKYKEAKEANSDIAELWKRRLVIYVRSAHGYAAGYNAAKYGEMVTPFLPLPFHEKCVRTLTRKELADYLLDFEMELFADRPIADLLKSFDQTARFEYSKETPECLQKESVTPIVTSGIAVGYGGLKIKQKMYRFTQANAGEFIRVVKSGPKKNKVVMDLVHESYDVRPFPLQRLGRIDDSHNEGMIFVPAPLNINSVALVVFEKQIGEFPTSPDELKLSFTRVWFDQNNVRHEAPLPDVIELPATSEANYGYYPVLARSRTISIDEHNAYYDPQDLDRQISGVQFYARKGHVIKAHIPVFDGRLGVAYQALEKTDPVTHLRILKPIGWLREDQGSFEFKANEDMEIFVVVTRLFNKKTRRDFDIQFEMTNEIPFALSPEIDPQPLDGTTLTRFGAHRTMEASFQVDWDEAGIPVGFGKHEISGGYDPFTPFRLIELNVKKGDLMLVRSNSGSVPPFWMIRKNGKRFETVGHYADFTHIKYKITEDLPHYLLLEDTPYYNLKSRIQTVDIQLRRASQEGPWTIHPKLLTHEEVSNQFGYGTVLEKLFADYHFEENAPKGFWLENSAFQLFEVSFMDTGRLKIFKPVGATHRMILGKINVDLWNEGKPSIEYITLHTEYDSTEKSRELEAGAYVLAIESGYNQGIGDAPFRLRYSAGKNAQAVFNVRPMSLAEMQDHRMRMKK